MRCLLVSILLSLLLITVADANAGSIARYGFGVMGSAVSGPTQMKVLSLGYNDELVGSLVRQVEVGLYTDNSGYGRHGSAFGFYSVGLQVNPGYLVMRSMWGAGFITSPDSMLGGPFQFTEELTLGVRDDKHAMIGVTFKHMSSAGIYDPNRGRDIVLLQMEIPW